MVSGTAKKIQVFSLRKEKEANKFCSGVKKDYWGISYVES